MAILSDIGHSSYYHRRFQDYMEITLDDENGKPHIERVYVGQYHSLEGDGRKRVGLKVLYAALYLASFVLFAVGESILTVSSLNKAVQLVVAVTVMAALFYGLAVFRYIIRPAEMTVWEYESGPVQVKRLGKLIAALQLLNAIAVVPFLAVTEGSGRMDEIRTLICCVLAALLMFAIDRIESSQRYRSRESDTQFVKGGYYID